MLMLRRRAFSRALSRPLTRSGMFADYFTVAVRTGGPGAGGLSFLLVERGMPGVDCKQMDCSGVWASGTAFVTFDNVRVPAGNLIGAENEGFKYIVRSTTALLTPLSPRASAA